MSTVKKIKNNKRFLCDIFSNHKNDEHFCVAKNTSSQSRKFTTGFTLIEMMVSVAIFAIVVTISMGAILTVVDSNKKAQSMKSVMNNLNFALETMTRTIKTGQITGADENGGLHVNVVDKDDVAIEYSLGSGDYSHRIVRIVNNNVEPITAPEVFVDRLQFIDITQVGNPSNGIQPSVVMVVKGTVKANTRVSSDFSIQTTITQRAPGTVASNP